MNKIITLAIVSYFSIVSASDDNSLKSQYSKIYDMQIARVLIGKTKSICSSNCLRYKVDPIRSYKKIAYSEYWLNTSCKLEIDSNYLLFIKKGENLVADLCFKILDGTFFQRDMTKDKDRAYVLIDYLGNKSFVLPKELNVEELTFEIEMQKNMVYRKQKFFRLEDFLGIVTTYND